MLHQKQFGKYEILSKLGRGMTDVYLALDAPDNRRAVLKIVEHSSDPWTQMVLEAERRGARIQRQLHEMDPRFIEVYDTGEFDGCYFVAMQYVEGKSVAEVLEGGRRLDPMLAARYGVDLCSQLQKLHSFQIEIDGRKRAVVHGDIKPSNMQICPDGSIRLLDFGISKAITFTRNLTNHNLGSPGYCSPERLRRAQVDPHSDLWALGASLYEMVAGLPPYQAHSTQRLEELIRSKRPPRALPDDCPAGLKAIIRKTLAGEIENRYASAAELGSDLQLFLDGQPTRAETEKQHAWEANPTVEKPRDKAGSLSGVPQQVIARLHRAWESLAGFRAVVSIPLPAPAGRLVRRIRIFFRGMWVPLTLAMVFGALLGGLVYIESVFAYRFWVESRPLRNERDYTRAGMASIEADWSLYKTLEQRNVPLGRFSPVEWLSRSLRSSYLAAADDVIERYRNSSDPALRDYDWRKAKVCLQHSAELAGTDPATTGKLALANAYLSLLEAPKAADAFTTAKRYFDEAASELPRSPDPHLGLARVYVYGFHNVGRAVAELADAERLGFRRGPREAEQLADGYLYRGAQEIQQAQKAIAARAETAGLLSLAKGDLERARNLYEPIAGFSDVSANLERLYRESAVLATLEAKREKAARPRTPARRARPWR